MRYLMRCLTLLAPLCAALPAAPPAAAQFIEDLGAGGRLECPRQMPSYSTLDADGDGVVNRMEFDIGDDPAENARLFALMDSNGDVAVSLEEMQEFRDAWQCP